jgi:hypothetical protein
MLPALFALVIFGVRSHVFVWASLTTILLFMLAVLLRWLMYTTMLSYWLRCSLANFLPKLASNRDPSNLHLLSCWDYGVSHRIWLLHPYFSVYK